MKIWLQLCFIALAFAYPAFGQSVSDPTRIEVYVTPYYNSDGPTIEVGGFSKGLLAKSEPRWSRHLEDDAILERTTISRDACRCHPALRSWFQKRIDLLVLLAPIPWPPVRQSGRSDRKSTRLNSSHVEISYAVF